MRSVSFGGAAPSAMAAGGPGAAGHASGRRGAPGGVFCQGRDELVRVLLIDDDERARTTIRKMLEGAGYEVAEAENGKVGLAVLAESPDFDVVVTDIIMPEREGIETIKEIRDTYAHIKIIAISGGGRMGYFSFLEHAESLGAQRTLRKPFKAGEIVGAIREVLSEGGRKERQTGKG